jgi:hypothetical protein
MELRLVKKDFTDNFLSVVSKTVDAVSVKVTKDGLYCICNKPDAGIILLGKYNHSIDVENDYSINLGDVKKLLRVIECIDEDELVFTINSNHLLYKSSSIQFKYHFLDDAIMPKVTVKKDKIEALTLDTFFDIDGKRLSEVLKASSFTIDTNKIYLFGQTDGVYCELGDKEKSNTDTINLRVSDKIEGQPLTQVIPFNLDIFRVLSSIKFDKARVGINLKLKVMSFYVKPTDNTEFKFTISGLVK